jgi:hypothetical protein
MEVTAKAAAILMAANILSNQTGVAQSHERKSLLNVLAQKPVMLPQGCTEWDDGIASFIECLPE